MLWAKYINIYASYLFEVFKFPCKMAICHVIHQFFKKKFWIISRFLHFETNQQMEVTSTVFIQSVFVLDFTFVYTRNVYRAVIYRKSLLMSSPGKQAKDVRLWIIRWVPLSHFSSNFHINLYLWFKLWSE